MSSELSQSQRTNLTPDTWRASGDVSLVGQLKAGWKNIHRAISPEARKNQTLSAGNKIDTQTNNLTEGQGRNIQEAVKAYAEAASLYLQADASPLWWKSPARTEETNYQTREARRLQEPLGIKTELLAKITDTLNLPILLDVYQQVLFSQEPNGQPNSIDIAQRKVMIRLLPDVVRQLETKITTQSPTPSDKDGSQEKEYLTRIKDTLVAQLAAVVSGGTTREFGYQKNFGVDNTANARDYRETVDISFKTLFQVDSFKADQLLATYLNNSDLTLAQKKELLAEAPLHLGAIRDIVESWSKNQPEPALMKVFLNRLKTAGVTQFHFHDQEWVPHGHATHLASKGGREVRETTDFQQKQVMEKLLAISYAGNRENARLAIEIWANSFGENRFRSVDFSNLDVTRLSPDVIAQLERFATGTRQAEGRGQAQETAPNLTVKEQWQLHDRLNLALLSYGDYGMNGMLTPTDEERVLTILREMRKVRSHFKTVPDDRMYFGNRPFQNIRLSRTITRRGEYKASSKWYARVSRHVDALNADAQRRNERAQQARRTS